MRNLRRLSTAAMLSAVLLGTALPASAATRVEPLKLDDCGLPAHWAAPYACDLKHQAIMQGDQSGFRFDDMVTRAEFVTLLVRALGLTPQDGASYGDVNGHWSAGYVKAAVTAGALKVNAGEQFRPNAPISRQDAITLLTAVLAGNKLADADERVLAGYTDAAKINPIERKAVAFALLHSVIQGDPDKALRPDQNLSRGESAKLISV
ncbi:MAG: 5-nucleotidase, partial [Firmicutes bacterium]|nr:5-nucleotidase [Bacillota bacterium]